MASLVQTNIRVEWFLAPTCCNKWHVGYYDRDNQIITPQSLADALKNARDSPSGYHVNCRPPGNRRNTVREIMGRFNDAVSVEFSYGRYTEPFGDSQLSMEGIEEFQALENIVMISGDNRSPVSVFLEGIEFCSNLRYLSCRSMNITNLAPLAHLELERLDVSFNPVADMRMIRAKTLVISAAQISLVKRAFKSDSFRIQSLHVMRETNQNLIFDDGLGDDDDCVIDWDLLILLDELQMELNARLAAEQIDKPMRSLQDLINGFDYSEVFWFEFNSYSISKLKLEIIKRIKNKLDASDQDIHLKITKRFEEPIFKEEPSPELAEIVLRISRREFNTNQLKFRELAMLWRFFWR